MSSGPVLVTGAGGFIGGRIAEVLHVAKRGPVRAGIRRWSTAAQIGRLDVELVSCDVLSAESVRRAADGVQAIVHCAVGSAEVNAQGTRTVLDVASALGIPRVVHLSTIDVYGRADGVFTESAPRLRTGAMYGDSKIAAEEAVDDARQGGLPVTVLRPTIVYGPGSASWTIEFAQRLQARNWLLSEEDTSGKCNLVYVDDVVGAVLRALEAERPVSDTFNVNGDEIPTWAEYFRRFNAAMGLPTLRPASQGRSRIAATAMAPVRKAAKLALKVAPGLITGLYQRSALAKRLMKQAESAIRQTPTGNEFHLYRLQHTFPIDKARATLGYAPAFTVDEGLALSVAWLRHTGYLPPDV